MISRMKKEPDWMRLFRHEALDIFLAKPMPTWGDTELLGTIDFDDIFYYIKPMEEQGKTWDDVPDDIKRTFDRLGIPEAEQKFLAGVSAQYESEVVYHSVQETLTKQGVIFMDMDTGLREHPEIVQKYFALGDPADRQQVRRAEQRGLVRRLVHLRPARTPRSRSRSRPTSGSTRRTWASSSGR